VLTLGVPALGGAQSTAPTGETYTWSGTLESFDAAARKMAVKSRVAYPEALADLKQFGPGEPVWVFWSGLHDFSDAVRQVRRPEAAGRIGETLVMPAEFVSTDAPDPYVTIRVTVPENIVATLKTLHPGEWITVTSRHRPSTDAEAVVGVRRYATPPETN
jgi:hypothetical protein